MGRGEESGAGLGVLRCWWKEEIPAGITCHPGDTKGILMVCPARGDGADPTRSWAHGSQITHAAVREGARPQGDGSHSRARGKGKLTLAQALPSSSFLQMTHLFQKRASWV